MSRRGQRSSASRTATRGVDGIEESASGLQSMPSNHFDTAQATAFVRFLSSLPAARIGLDCGAFQRKGQPLAKEAVPKASLGDSTEDAIALIGTRIRDVRTMQGMPLRALADQTGLSMSMLSLVERGKTSPSI